MLFGLCKMERSGIHKPNNTFDCPSAFALLCLFLIALGVIPRPLGRNERLQCEASNRLIPRPLAAGSFILRNFLLCMFSFLKLIYDILFYFSR